MKRRIVLVLGTTFRFRGGIQRFNQMMCLALDRLCPELGIGGHVICQGDLEQDYVDHGAPWKHLKFVAGGSQAGITARALGLCVKTRPDCMLIGLLGMTPVGVVCAPFLRGGFGFVAHGTESWEIPKASRRFSARRARFVIAVSDETRRALHRAAGIPLESIRLLPNTLKPGFERVPDDASNVNLAAGPSLLTVSRLETAEQTKGVDKTIEAVARLVPRHPGLRYVIVGKGSDRSRLEALVESKRVSDRVEFVQDLTDEELAARYRACSAFVLPSGQEGFGIVFLEAMRFSKPCIGGNAGGTPEVIEQDVTGLLVPYGDVDSLEQAVDRLVSDPALQERMGRAGRERLEREFVFERFQERLATHLRQLLGL